MIKRSLLAASAAITFAFLAQPDAAQASIGMTSLRYLGYLGSDQDEHSISCSEGRRIVRRVGYGSVSSLRCFGDVYRYRGSRRGYAWQISVDASSGAIVETRRIGAIH